MVSDSGNWSSISFRLLPGSTHCETSPRSRLSISSSALGSNSCPSSFISSRTQCLYTKFLFAMVVIPYCAPAELMVCGLRMIP